MLVETSCKSRPTYRAWCAVESMAQQNPEAKVWYVMTAPAVEARDGLPPRLLQQYTNLRVVTTDLWRIFNNTPLMPLYTSGAWNINTKWPAVNLSNMVRLALVWRVGGFYSDTDVVCISSLATLRNVVGFQLKNEINNAVFHFDRHHDLMKLMMTHFIQGFEADTNEIPEINNYSVPDEFNLANIAVTRDMVIKQINKLKQNKSQGPDELFSRHGFTRGRFCLTNSLTFFNRTFEAVDSDKEYDIVYLDFSKAFDRVPHKRLLRKVEAHGIGVCDTCLLHLDQGNVWGKNGPMLFTQVMKEVCGKPSLTPGDHCGGVSLLSPKAFYPIPYRKWEFAFLPSKRSINFTEVSVSYHLVPGTCRLDTRPVLSISQYTELDDEYNCVSTSKGSVFSDSYMIHMWNKLSHLEPVFKESGSIYDVAAKTFCPVTRAVATAHSSLY
ncbi:lactosylceramide 4-alpha-galactosyltransferase-like [Cherax quadricarinatus]|uniref:lactosylceramide 4-alpha-galactosyltransferase-like n=1 Tax=Cherax quadricarinatus TaxID=27406 RepID=UPI00387E7E09